MGSHSYVHKIHEDLLCELLGVDSRALQKLMRRRGFPNPTDSDADGPFWPKALVREWLASSQYRPLSSLQLDWWPDATAPAGYLGAEQVRARPSAPGPAVVFQRWITSHGAHVVVCWTMPNYMVSGRQILEWAPRADAYLRIGHGWGLYAPDVFVVDGDGDSRDIEWADMARVLGRPAPYWSSRLRDPGLITAWRPDEPPARHPGVPAVDIDPLLRLAVLYADDHPVHKTLTHYARVIQAAAAAEDGVDVGLVRDALGDGRLTPEQITVAAEGVPVAETELEDLPETTRRIGWREVLHRDDVFAEQCVMSVRGWSGGEDMPHPHGIEISRTAHGSEFLARLTPTTRTAMFAILDPDREAMSMIDPETDIPVAIPPSTDESIHALATNALPTVSPLAELVLEEPIWVRTEDGTLFPAPYHSYYGLSWGYSGTGPRTLATLVSALLDNITAPGVEPASRPPAGLFELFQHEWPSGTVLSRAQLEAARDGRPDIPGRTG